MIFVNDSATWGPFVDGHSLQTGMAILPDDTARHATVVRRGVRRVLYVEERVIAPLRYGVRLEYDALLAAGHSPWQGEVKASRYL
jgi:hypothetical protein